MPQWIGDRTRQIDGAHVECVRLSLRLDPRPPSAGLTLVTCRFFRGIRNPIGIKVGPTSSPEELVRLLGIVDPKKEAGRVTLISRYGADLVSGLQSEGIGSERHTADESRTGRAEAGRTH